MAAPHLRLDADWRYILRRAWSVRLMALAVLLTIAEALLPLVSWLPDLHYSALSIVTIIGAMWARIVAQRGL